MRYQGGCHCNSIQFEVDSEVITRGFSCNCSICRRKNAIMSEHYYSDADFKIIKGKELLSCYLWGDRLVNHFFCSRCGIYPFHNGVETPNSFRINLGCIDELDLNKLEIITFDGKNII
ncbi:GFA family protein [Aliikangiella sp. IMCC44653]